MVSEWRVAEEMVTLSDHRHILFDVELRPSNSPSHPDSSSAARRWALKLLNRDMLIAAANVVACPEHVHSQGTSPDPEEEAAWFRDSMTSIRDASIPRVRCAQRLDAVYWWSADIAHLRSCAFPVFGPDTSTNAAGAEDSQELQSKKWLEPTILYRDSTMALQHDISDARSRTWRELLEGLDRVLCKRPYKMVMAKLRPSVSPITETMDPGLMASLAERGFRLWLVWGLHKTVVQQLSSRGRVPLRQEGSWISLVEESGLKKEDSESPSAYHPICLLLQ